MQASKLSFFIPKFFCFALLTCGMLLAPLSLQAHPPRTVTLAYAAQSLKVEIAHASPMPSRHYINKVEIRLNGQPVSSNHYTGQPGQQPFSYIYELNAVRGDKIEVKVSCNIFGSKSATLIVP